MEFVNILQHIATFFPPTAKQQSQRSAATVMQVPAPGQPSASNVITLCTTVVSHSIVCHFSANCSSKRQQKTIWN